MNPNVRAVTERIATELKRLTVEERLDVLVELVPMLEPRPFFTRGLPESKSGVHERKL